MCWDARNNGQERRIGVHGPEALDAFGTNRQVASVTGTISEVVVRNILPVSHAEGAIPIVMIEDNEGLNDGVYSVEPIISDDMILSSNGTSVQI